MIVTRPERADDRLRHACWSPTAARSPSASSRTRAGARPAHGRGVLRRRPRRRRTCGSPTRRCALGPGAAARELPARRRDPGGRARHRRRARSTPATASSPRTPASPRAVEAAGLAFVGPTPGAAASCSAPSTRPATPAAAAGRAAARRHRPARRRSTTAVAAADAIGYPVMLKATGGGGGIGMRAVPRPPTSCADAWDARAPRRRGAASAPAACSSSASSSAPATSRCRSSATARGGVVVARRPRLLAAAPQPEGRRGGAGARPRPTRVRERLARRGPRPVRASVGYRSAGTVEFVYDAERERGRLPRGQHPAAGGAPGHRGGLRRRPGRVDGAARRGATPPSSTTAAHAARPRRRGPRLRRGPRPRPPARAPGCSPRCAFPRGVRVDTLGRDRHRGHRRTTTRCWPRSSSHGADRADALRRAAATRWPRTRLDGIETNLGLLRAVARRPATFARPRHTHRARSTRSRDPTAAHRGARRRDADHRAGLARPPRATGTSACRRAGRWTTCRSGSATGRSATPRARRAWSARCTGPTLRFTHADRRSASTGAADGA